MNTPRLVNFALSSVLLAVQFQIPGADIAGEIENLHRGIGPWGDPSAVQSKVAALEREIAQFPSAAQRGDFYIREAEAVGAAMKPAAATPVILRLTSEGLACDPGIDMKIKAFIIQGDALRTLEYDRIDNTVKSNSLRSVAVARLEKFNPKIRARIADAYLRAIALLAEGVVDDTAQSGKMALADIPPREVAPGSATSPVKEMPAGKKQSNVQMTMETGDGGNPSIAAHKAAIRHNALVFRYRKIAGKLATLYTDSDADKKELAALAGSRIKTPGLVTQLLDYIGANRLKRFGSDLDVPVDGNFWSPFH